MDTADQKSKGGMRWAIWSAVLVIAGIGAAAFVLSFAALQDLAIIAGTHPKLAWLFPVIVDGTIVQATMAVIVLGPNAPERAWFSRVLLVGAAVSVGSNAIHAYITGHGIGGAFMAAIPPLALLIDTHGLALLLRAAQRNSVPAAVEPDPFTADEVPAVAVPALSVKPLAPVVPVQPIRTSRPMPPRPVPVPSGGN
ncbi:DUF2637 domain-containing protein [Nocardia sp. NPDC058705]|uniref:DUF2637 domain-containing protein n=1 Tax=Nocardia sp. NPDC058705 TaxID=3346609 RepID=UPI003683DA01